MEKSSADSRGSCDMKNIVIVGAGDLGKEVVWLIEDINKRGTTVLVVTHNKELVNQFQKRVITMRKGRIARDEEEGGYIEA